MAGDLAKYKRAILGLIQVHADIQNHAKNTAIFSGTSEVTE
jgi:hypothetical protein